MKTLVTMGRGGTGKTSFVALMAKYFIQHHASPILLVDVDPDQNLAEMVGVDLEQSGIRTISELIMETFLKKGGTTVGIPPTERIETSIWERGLYEGGAFDLIAIRHLSWIQTAASDSEKLIGPYNPSFRRDSGFQYSSHPHPLEPGNELPRFLVLTKDPKTLLT